jgi:cytochrome P450
MTFGGMETTSNALARILYLLCEHPEAQEKLRQEVRDARKIGGSIPYDDLMMSLPYLDAVCKETLRVYVCSRRTSRRVFTY